jgi:hypothetical protein
MDTGNSLCIFLKKEDLHLEDKTDKKEKIGIYLDWMDYFLLLEP